MAYRIGMTGPARRDFSALRVSLIGSADEAIERAVPLEAPVALEYNGIAYAVMMATPSDLLPYMVGFALSEGLVRGVDDFIAVDIHQAEQGWVVRATVPPEQNERVIARARRRVSESSCGLCGLDSIAEAVRPLPPVTARITTTRDAIARALHLLTDHQPLGRATGAVHAAAFCSPDGAILAASEDVGRHNALDKLLGQLALARRSAEQGFILLTARCSFELVEKTVRANCPMLVTISAPTSLAVERARAADLTLISLARADAVLVLNDSHRSILA